jgi:RNA polymerase II subunit A small phosphatase-like protein
MADGKRGVGDLIGEEHMEGHGQRPSERRRLLVLDLDETLIHAADVPLPARAPDFRAGRYHAYKRPHIDAFLAGCLARFDTAIWTSASPDYAAECAARLLPDPSALAFLWASDRCARAYDPDAANYYWRKPLAKLRRLRRARGLGRGDVLAVDDSPEKWELSWGNLISVRPFTGDPDDDELPHLLAYLDAIRDEPDWRTLDKRGWRSHLAAAAEDRAVGPDRTGIITCQGEDKG